LAVAIEDTYLIDPIGKKVFYLKPITTTNPPKMFGHCGVVVTDATGAFDKKYLYVYGGASGDCAQNVCDKMWRLELPWAPVGYFSGFAGQKFGNKWEDVSGGGAGPGQLFSAEMIQVGSLLYIYGGMDQAFGISDKLWAYDTATMLWAEITLVPHSYTQVNQVWDGSSYTQAFTGSLASKRIMPHLGYDAASNLLYVSKGYSTQDTVWLA
jgi:hypothetical protein